MLGLASDLPNALVLFAPYRVRSVGQVEEKRSREVNQIFKMVKQDACRPKKPAV